MSSALIVVLSMSCWFLVPAARRERFWWGFDAALAVAFVLVSTLFPISPTEGDETSLLRAVVRVSVTTIFGVRLTLRLVGPLLSLFERIGFRSMVAARHLRAKKTGFLAASSTLSILAVAVSSCMLISVLSVMGGFRADLEKKILGNHAHIVIDKAYEELDDWEPLLTRTRETEGVVGATPFLQVEVMVSSLSNRAGAILRGIDPETVSEVTDLAQNLTHGKLEYLQHPERILDSSIDTTKTGALDAMIQDAEHAAAKGLPTETKEDEHARPHRRTRARPGASARRRRSRHRRLPARRPRPHGPHPEDPPLPNRGDLLQRHVRVRHEARLHRPERGPALPPLRGPDQRRRGQGRRSRGRSGARRRARLDDRPQRPPGAGLENDEPAALRRAGPREARDVHHPRDRDPHRGLLGLRHPHPPRAGETPGGGDPQGHGHLGTRRDSDLRDRGSADRSGWAA